MNRRLTVIGDGGAIESALRWWSVHRYSTTGGAFRSVFIVLIGRESPHLNRFRYRRGFLVNMLMERHQTDTRERPGAFAAKERKKKRKEKYSNIVSLSYAADFVRTIRVWYTQNTVSDRGEH